MNEINNRDLIINTVVRTNNLSFLWNTSILMFMLAVISIIMREWAIMGIFVIIGFVTMYQYEQKESDLRKMLTKAGVERT